MSDDRVREFERRIGSTFDIFKAPKPIGPSPVAQLRTTTKAREAGRLIAERAEARDDRQQALLDEMREMRKLAEGMEQRARAADARAEAAEKREALAVKVAIGGLVCTAVCAAAAVIAIL